MIKEDYINNAGFCPAPWNEIYISPQGEIDNCCVGNNKLGNVKSSDIEEVVLGSKQIKIKQEMLSGSLPSGCSNCNTSGPTLRTNYLEWFNDYAPSEFYQTPSNFNLNYLDLRWRNTCNSACVYCSPTYSSLWAQELGVNEKINVDSLDKLKAFIEPYIPTLKKVYLAGGEPLLIKDNEWLLEKLLASNPDCEIVVNTNLSSIDNRIAELLNEMTSVQWIVSIDSTKDQYEYIRYGSKWSVFESNLKKLIKRVGIHGKTDPGLCSFQMVYCSLNTTGIFDAVDYLSNMGFSSNNMNLYYVHGGTGSGWLDPRNLPKEYVDTSIDVLQSRLEQSKDSNFTSKIKTLNEIINTPISPTPGYLDPSMVEGTFYEELAKLDIRRNLNSQQIFPHLYK
jgi:radical SAM protein with 4Fe4S-binding SPASM domain